MSRVGNLALLVVAAPSLLWVGCKNGKLSLSNVFKTDLLPIWLKDHGQETEAKNQCRSEITVQCTCFEVLQVAHYLSRGQKVGVADVKKGYRQGSKLYHADKMDGADAGGFLFLTACRDILTIEDTLEQYNERILHLETKKDGRNWSEQQYRIAVEELNDYFFALQSSTTQLNTEDSIRHQKKKSTDGLFSFVGFPPFTSGEKRDERLNQMHLFLDDSGSMVDNNVLALAHKALRSIKHEISRTPTSVHFIGWQSHLVVKAGDNIGANEIIRHWNGASGGTQLWEYVFNHLKKRSRELKSASTKDDAVIITDGHDNMSSGKFYGPNGFLYMMELLNKDHVNIRISVLCLGELQFCSAGNYADLSMATGGIYKVVSPKETSNREKISQIDSFAAHITASEAHKARHEIDERLKYEKLLAAGRALALPGYVPVEVVTTANVATGQREASVPISPPNNSSENAFSYYMYWSTLLYDLIPSLSAQDFLGAFQYC